MEGKKRPSLRMLMNRCHHGDSERYWGHSRRRVRTLSPIEDWELVQKNHGSLAILLKTDLSKYLSHLNIGKRPNNERNHTKINI